MDASRPTAAQVAAFPGIQKVPNPKLDLFIIRNFLSADRCAEFCAMIDIKRRPSTIADDRGEANFRTSETCDLDGDLPIVCDLRIRLSDLIGIDPAHAEAMQGQRYAPGQEFKPHTDTFNPGGADYYVHCADQGQRTWTAMLYLNEPEAGGATRFKAINKTVQPETGKLLLWNNLSPDGSPNPATLHQGMKVRKGTKYVVTQWYREFPLPNQP